MQSPGWGEHMSHRPAPLQWVDSSLTTPMKYTLAYITSNKSEVVFCSHVPLEIILYFHCKAYMRKRKLFVNNYKLLFYNKMKLISFQHKSQ